MSDPNAYTLTGLGALLILNIGNWIKIIYDNRKTNGKPGTGQTCIKHGEEIAILKTEIKNIDRNMTNIKNGIDRIETHVNGK